jgi:hypothetical protein
MNICLIGQSSHSESGLLARLTVAPAVAFALTACHQRQKTPAPGVPQAQILLRVGCSLIRSWMMLYSR